MVFGSTRIFFILASFIGLVQLVVGTDVVKCNASHSCPESLPCCSQYGQCGTGAYCLGGCDVRFSYNLSACMPMPVMDSFKTTFDSKDVLKKQDDYLGNASESDWIYTGYVGTHDDAVLLQMPNHTSGTVISSTKYLWYGKVSAKLKTSHRRGVVTAFILYSNVQDEIDFESVGYNLTAPQSNYYSHGILDYKNAKNSTTSDTFENYHDYTIDWKEDKIEWFVDGEKVRTLLKNDTWNDTSKRHDYPQTPSRVQLSLWPAGDPSNGKGTIEWAGGEIDWDAPDIKDNGYYYAYVKELNVTAYDLPSGVKKVNGSDHSNHFDAFLYNSTKGNDDDIYLTNKKAWLGNGKATGFDPDNDSDSDDDDDKKSKSSKSTNSSGKTKTKTNANVPTGKGVGNQGGNLGSDSTDNGSSTNTYDPDSGFVQNSKHSSGSGSSGGKSGGKSSSSKNDASTFDARGTLALVGGLILGFLSLF